jgi:hypothetical protein
MRLEFPAKSLRLPRFIIVAKAAKITLAKNAPFHAAAF